MHQSSEAPSWEDIELLAFLCPTNGDYDAQSDHSTDTEVDQEEEAEEEATLPSIKSEPMTPPTDLSTSKISTFEFRPLPCPFEVPITASESVPIKSETSGASLSSILNHHIADLTGSTRAQTSRLQQLKPLEVPRNGGTSHQGQPKPQVENHIAILDLSLQSQLKQPRKNAPTDFFNKLKLVTSDAYEDTELHGDFKHMLHILIPSNATNALLEQRGQPIQSISQQTGCTLSIRDPHASPFKDNRLLRIYGKAKCISLAQRLVIAYIRAFRAEKKDPIYMDLSDNVSPIALPATSITKAMNVAVTAGKKSEVEITNPFHWMVQRDEVGKMMGRRGCTLASIRHKTGALVRVDKDVVPGTTERRVTLSGSVESIAAAVEMIKSKSNGRPEVAVNVVKDRHGQYFAIPYHAAGYLIGLRGSLINRITEQTGARLQMPSAEDLPLGSLNRILHVQGTPKQAEHARQIVAEKLHDFLVSSKSPKSLSLSSTGLKGDKVTIKALLPSRICGLMLDQRGRLTREISKKSGAHTHFLAAYDHGNRVCVFTGDMSCVLRAQRLVLQVIAGDALSSKMAAPIRKRKRSRRDEEKDEEYDEVVVEVVKDEQDEQDEEKCCCGDKNEDALRRRNIRQQPNCRLRHDYEENEEDMYIYDNSTEYEELPCQPMRRQPVAIRPRKYFEDEDDVDNYGFDEYDPMSCNVPRSRPPVGRRQSVSRRRNESDDVSDSDGVYEESIVEKQMAKIRPIDSSAQRQPIAYFCRKVQMMVSNPRPREGRSLKSPTDRRCATDTDSPSRRNGSANMRHSVPQGGRGNGRSRTKRDRKNDNKRRRQ